MGLILRGSLGCFYTVSSHSSCCSLGQDKAGGRAGTAAGLPLMRGSDQCFPKWGMCGKFLTDAKHVSSCVHSRGLNIVTSINHPHCPDDKGQALQSPSRLVLSRDCLVSDRLHVQWVLEDHS